MITLNHLKMEIKYLKILESNPAIASRHSDYIYKLKPMMMSEIVKLESIYNHSEPFPAALRELLFLAGSRCYALDYGTEDTRQEMQEETRDALAASNKNINRPYFALEVHDGADSFLFVYLDEGIEDPEIYVAYPQTMERYNEPWLRKYERKLSECINERTMSLLNGKPLF
jgi:hypothetical protein